LGAGDVATNATSDLSIVEQIREPPTNQEVTQFKRNPKSPALQDILKRGMGGSHPAPAAKQ
jgi:hypothetical protein